MSEMGGAGISAVQLLYYTGSDSTGFAACASGWSKLFQAVAVTIVTLKLCQLPAARLAVGNGPGYRIT
jgi:hypothetical protein